MSCTQLLWKILAETGMLNYYREIKKPIILAAVTIF